MGNAPCVDSYSSCFVTHQGMTGTSRDVARRRQLGESLVTRSSAIRIHIPRLMAQHMLLSEYTRYNLSCMVYTRICDRSRHSFFSSLDCVQSVLFSLLTGLRSFVLLKLQLPQLHPLFSATRSLLAPAWIWTLGSGIYSDRTSWIWVFVQKHTPWWSVVETHSSLATDRWCLESEK